MNAYRWKLAALCSVMLAALPASAQDKGDRTVEQYSCKDVMRESGANRDVAIAFLHGFIVGKSGDNKFNVETLRKQTDAFIERCLENPGVKAFDAMNEAKK
jgi:hypothetical protein